mmetsp:Transcript_8937/g.16528  ORF Transcript_8937/g.16528 Transcript_8937/m.16528 type:complete len:215 (-) Transcript_8937:178-822(-)
MANQALLTSFKSDCHARLASLVLADVFADDSGQHHLSIWAWHPDRVASFRALRICQRVLRMEWNNLDAKVLCQSKAAVQVPNIKCMEGCEVLDPRFYVWANEECSLSPRSTRAARTSRVASVICQRRCQGDEVSHYLFRGRSCALDYSDATLLVRRLGPRAIGHANDNVIKPFSHCLDIWAVILECCLANCPGNACHAAQGSAALGQSSGASSG